MGLSFTEKFEPLKLRTWPPAPSFEEVSKLRRERIQLIVALGRKDFEYAEKFLDAVDYESKTPFWLQTIALVVWPAREYLKNAYLPRDFLVKKLRDGGYADDVIEQYCCGML